MADRPKLLLLEGVFENLDPSDRNQVISFITSKDMPWTLVAASSDPLLAQQCGQIILMQDGKITATGSYADMKKIANLKLNRDA